jgi:hypothetical protein
MPSRRSAAIISANKLFPDGIAMLDTDGLSHPEASRMSRIGFAFAVGRVVVEGKMKAVRELDLVADRVGDTPDLADRIVFYAREIVRTAPGIGARLHGRSLDRIYPAERTT